MTVAAGSISGLSAVLTRIQSLDALIRTVDPTWGGLGGSAATSASSPAASSTLGSSGISTFAQALADAEADSAAASPSSSAAAASGTSPAAASPSVPALAAGATFRSPLPGGTLTQPYGPTDLSLEPSATVNGVYYAHFHNGIDLAAPLGTPVLAAAAGRVVQAGVNSDGAVLVTIEHADGSRTRYAHLQPDLPVKIGDTVEAGETIGRVGMTGNTTGPHVHFDLWRNGVAIDPQPWLDAGRLPGEPVPVSGSSSGPDGLNATDGSGTAPATAQVLARFDRTAGTIPYGAEIKDAAKRANVDPFLLASLVLAESSYDPKSVSWAGAMGLTQLMPETAKSLKVTDPFDPVQNLRGGARYLASDLRIFGRVDLALAAYQAGKGAVQAAGGVPNYPVTRAYIARILSTWKGYLEQSA